MHACYIMCHCRLYDLFEKSVCKKFEVSFVDVFDSSTNVFFALEIKENQPVKIVPKIATIPLHVMLTIWSFSFAKITKIGPYGL